MKPKDCLLDLGAFQGFYSHFHPVQTGDIFSLLKTRLNDDKIPKHSLTQLLMASSSHNSIKTSELMRI